MTFKKGDIVQRTGSGYGECEGGRIYTIAEDQQNNTVALVGVGGRYLAECFVPVPQPAHQFTDPVRVDGRLPSLAADYSDQHTPGAKLDKGKVRPSLILNGMARALTAVAEVGTFGANKYTDGGWVHVPNGFARYEDAQQRHALARAKGEERDPESQLLHLAHEAWNALAKLDLYLREQEKAG